jgi:hypothetical protein
MLSGGVGHNRSQALARRIKKRGANRRRNTFGNPPRSPSANDSRNIHAPLKTPCRPPRCQPAVVRRTLDGTVADLMSAAASVSGASRCPPPGLAEFDRRHPWSGQPHESRPRSDCHSSLPDHGTANGLGPCSTVSIGPWQNAQDCPIGIVPAAPPRPGTAVDWCASPALPADRRETLAPKSQSRFPLREADHVSALVS